ncbi:hypothetical protein [Pimelobacter simplex]|uniref:hypothetical protein n=1 Tax=Nocardioides simplex TaxID=2045 RepID=UPI0019338614|nr:hypothetical protein [Pimelobacter simplex]
MNQAIHEPAVDTALQQFRDMMAADGYLLSWYTVDDTSVTVKIDATADACADCLVPKPVMEAIMNQALAKTPYRLNDVILPASEH